ncbi:MAG: HAD-IA family hydrolase [Halobacteriovoraceae bacterium]|nr:HAD-IA family hydrolase [Halobacteriovoraceae bacterium]
MGRKHIVFDCDGTLVDSHSVIFDAIQMLMTEHLEREVTLEEVKQKYSADMPTVAAEFGIDVRDQQTAGKLLKRWQEVSQIGNEEIALYPEITELLEQLKNSDTTTLLWTARDRRSTEYILKRAGIEQYFEKIVCADDTKLPKPFPDGLELLGRDFPKESMILIGDSAADLKGAQSFGIPLVAACWNEWADHKIFAQDGKLLKANTPLQCLDLFKKLNGVLDV